MEKDGPLEASCLNETLASGPSSLEPSTVDQSGPVLGNERSLTPLIKRAAVSKVLETAAQINRCENKPPGLCFPF